MVACVLGMRATVLTHSMHGIILGRTSARIIQQASICILNYSLRLKISAVLALLNGVFLKKILRKVILEIYINLILSFY